MHAVPHEYIVITSIIIIVLRTRVGRARYTRSQQRLEVRHGAFGVKECQGALGALREGVRVPAQS